MYRNPGGPSMTARSLRAHVGADICQPMGTWRRCGIIPWVVVMSTACTTEFPAYQGPSCVTDCDAGRSDASVQVGQATFTAWLNGLVPGPQGAGSVALTGTLRVRDGYAYFSALRAGTEVEASPEPTLVVAQASNRMRITPTRGLRARGIEALEVLWDADAEAGVVWCLPSSGASSAASVGTATLLQSSPSSDAGSGRLYGVRWPVEAQGPAEAFETSTLLFEPSAWRLTDRVAGPMAGASPGSGRAQILPDGATVLGAESGTPTSETWEGLLGGGSGVFVAQTRGPVLAGSVPGPSGWFAVRVADRPSAPEVEGAWRAAGFRVDASGRVVPSPVEWTIEAGAFQWRPLDGEGTRAGSLQSVDANAEGASGAGHRLVLGDIGELDVLNAVFSPNRRVAVVWRSVGGQPVDGAWLAVRAAPTN